MKLESGVEQWFGRGDGEKRVDWRVIDRWMETGTESSQTWEGGSWGRGGTLNFRLGQLGAR